MSRARKHLLGSNTLRSVALFCGVWPGWGCAASSADATWLEQDPEAKDGVEIASLESPIIGGQVARSPALDHTGALVYRVRATGEMGPLCTASLIAPVISPALAGARDWTASPPSACAWRC